MRLFFILFFFLMTGITNAQSAKELLAIANSTELTETNFYEEMPYEDKFGYIIIKVKIGEETYDYIYDTGGYNTLTSDIMSKNELPTLVETEVGSANQIKSMMTITKIPTVDIGGIEFNEVGAFNIDFDQAPQIQCYTNGGLIGKGLIRHAVWQINSVDQKITLTDDIEKLSNLENAIRLKVDFDKTYNPFIKAKVNGKNLNFLLDLGYGGMISLVEKDGEKFASEKKVKAIGQGSVGANGAIFEDTFYTDLKSFELGGVEIPNQFARYGKSNNYNLIGAEITKHFILTLNFKEKELWLTSIQNSNGTDPKEVFGLDLDQKGEKVYVSKLFEGLPADQAGIKLEDQVVSINGKKVESFESYCHFYDYLQEIFINGSEANLEVLRDEEIELFELSKSPLIE